MARATRAAAGTARGAAGEAASPSGRVRKALAEVARAPFVHGELVTADPMEPFAPAPRALPPAETVAALCDALALSDEARVLEVGAGSGYLSAVLSRLALQVFTVERAPAVALRARNRLRALGFGNVLVRRGEGLEGWPEEAPFDAIVVSASAGHVGPELLEQLRVGGTLVMPQRPFRIEQHLVRYRRAAEGRFERDDLGSFRQVPRLGDLLVESGLVERDAVEGAAVERRAGERLGEALVRLRGVGEDEVYRALALQHGLSFASQQTLAELTDLAVARRTPRAFSERHQVIPLRWIGNDLVLASTDPRLDIAEHARLHGATRARCLLITPTDFRRFWTLLDVGDASLPAPGAPASRRDVDLLAQGGVDLDSHAVALLDALLLDAIAERASDVHLEIYGDRVRVRLRVDGDLQDAERFQLTPADLCAVINVLKVSARLDITEHRLPQGGRFRRRAGEHHFDLRLQTQPTLHGEHAVLRLLPEEAHRLGLEELGFLPSVVAAWKRLMESPQGLVLVVGPTGCGKTTTLYTALQLLAQDPTRKVITVEDPIEYAIPGIQQSQVLPELGFGFADAMRSFVRQDPDVILVGEVRDGETALEAIRASQTGHLVYSTLHCNDAVDSVQRLHDLGMHPNSVAAELLAVLAQRLGRRACEACRVPAELEPDLVAEVFPHGVPAGFGAQRGRGCERCGGRGTRGRVAVAELLFVREALREVIARRPALHELRRAAREQGLVPLRDGALQLVALGVLPFGELKQLLTAEQLLPDHAVDA